MSTSMRGLYLLLYFLLGSGATYTQEKISAREAAVLSACFESILECEAGYVLYGKKPLCIIEYFQNSFYFEPREDHQLSTAICVAKNVLQRPLFQAGNIIFHFDEKDENLLVINKQQFLKVVKDNLVLFQYVLGPTITPEQLLTAITSPDHSFCEVLNYDRVLIGIALGYGVQNCLFQSRFENIQEDLITTADLPPFLPNVAQYSDASLQEDLLFLEKSPRSQWAKNRAFLKPSYGFSSLEAERDEILNRQQICSEKLQEKPYFIFGCLKDSRENALLLADLEATQEKIKTLLQSQSLVKDVLALIVEDAIAIDEKALDFASPSVDLNLVIAKLLKSGLHEYEKKYISYFVEGLKGLVTDEALEGTILPFPHAISTVCKAKQNLEEANHFFAKLAKNRSYTKMVEPYLYYSVLSAGDGPALQDQREVVVDYEIFDPSGKSLASELHKRLDLSETIPAFSYGIRGMREGEKRELFIHPALAYGVHTYLNKGIHLKAVIALHHIYDSPQKLSPPTPVDLAFVLAEGFLQKCEKDHKRALRLMGQQRREFLESCPGINVEQIVKAFQSDTSVLTQTESDAINQFFWRMYFTDAPTP